MKKKIYLILSASSDIGANVAFKWLQENKTVIGTYRIQNKNTKLLKKYGCKLYKVDFSKKDQILKFTKKIKKYYITNILSAVGTQEPIGKLININFDNWEKSILINAVNQIRCIVQIYKNHKKKLKVVLFAGGGTNNATESYSAYTLSKIMLIKFSELISFEEKNICCSILGPGWVKTKIHKATLKNKKAANKNFSRTIKKLRGDECVPMKKVLECVEWMFKKDKKTLGGRNISLVYDNWGSNKLDTLLKSDENIYKLRRFKNDIFIRKKIVNERNYEKKIS
jgi:short-subunit dehydrogenase